MIQDYPTPAYWVPGSYFAPQSQIIIFRTPGINNTPPSATAGGSNVFLPNGLSVGGGTSGAIVPLGRMP